MGKVAKVGGEGINKEFGITVYTLLYIKQTVNKYLLYSRGNSTVFCSNLCGKGVLKRMDICICIDESLCCTPETNTTL